VDGQDGSVPLIYLKHLFTHDDTGQRLNDVFYHRAAPDTYLALPRFVKVLPVF
jgi:hypothetical protein